MNSNFQILYFTQPCFQMSMAKPALLLVVKQAQNMQIRLDKPGNP